MNRLQRSSINMLLSSVGYAVPMLINLLTTPILLHLLGEEAYGLQSLVAVIIGYLTFMDLGLNWPIIKLLAEDRAQQNVDAENLLLNTTLQLYLAIGLVGLLVLNVSASWLARSVFQVPPDLFDQSVMVFRLAGIGFLGSVGMSWGNAVAKGLQRFELSYSVSIILSTAGTLLGLGVVYAGYGVVGYVLMRTIFTMLAGPIYFLVVRRLLPSFTFRFGLNRSTLKRASGYLGYGSANRILSSLVSRLDQTLIGIWVGVAAAGVYAVPYMLVNSLGYMLAHMLGFIFPMASELQSLGKMGSLREIFAQASQFLVALAGLIFIPLCILGDSLLVVWTPSIASQATVVLRLLALAGYVGTVTVSLANNVLIGLGYMRQFTVYSTIRAIVLAMTCFIFIRSLGLVGAGWALLLTTCSVDIVYLVIVLRRYLQIAPWELFRQSYLKPMLLGIGFAGLTVLARPFATSWLGLGLAGFALALIYLLASFAIGVFGETEKRAVIGLFQMVRKKT